MIFYLIKYYLTFNLNLCKIKLGEDMISLKVKEVLEYGEYRVDQKSIEFIIGLNIYGLDRLNVGDLLMLHEELFDKSNENYTMPLFFEVTNEKTAKIIKEENNKEFGAVKTNGKILVIKRIYG